jgi:TolA-binding protein
VKCTKHSRNRHAAGGIAGERRLSGRAVLFVSALVFLLGATGCVYYNLFYNTKKLYETAEEVPLQPDGSLNRTALDSYQQCITKSQKLIDEHPDSKYVDDALLLMGKCHYKREEYTEAVASLEKLLTEHPDSEFREEAQLYTAQSLLGAGEREQAVENFAAVIESNPKSKFAPEILYLLGTNLIRLDREEEAFPYLERLANEYPRTKYRVQADLEIAAMFMERGEYERSLKVYKRLGKRKLKRADRVRYYMGLSELRAKMGDYEKALEAISFLDNKVFGEQMQAKQLLRKGEAYAGVDSVARAIDLYKSVVARYPRSSFSAEADFKLGVLFQESLDSLDVAKTYFDDVPRQFPKSEFAEDAIQRSVSITKVKRLESSLQQGGQSENAADVKFELAETQFFQFKDYEKALAGYKEVLSEYPTSAVAPKAAYAIAYIYSDILKDVDKARVAYQRVIDDYPDSQQAQYARAYIEKNPAQLESRNERSN